MDLQEIQDKLNALLSGSAPERSSGEPVAALSDFRDLPKGKSSSEGRKIVFWYDDDASYAEEVDSIELKEGSRLWKLTGRNTFATKLLIEEQEPETSFLIYAPFARPEDKGNPLTDMFYYAEHFYSDKLIQLMGDLNIPPECQDDVKRYKKFWTSGNVEKFKALQITDYTKDTVELGIICTLVGVKTLRFEEALRKVVLAGEADNALLKKLENQKIEGVFWKLCEKNYGYKDINPTVSKFLVTMLVTYIDTQMMGNEPKEWKGFLSAKKNDAVIFIKDLMAGVESRDFYDKFAAKAARELKTESLLAKIPLESVLACDAFTEFDDNLLHWMTVKIEDSMLDEKIDGQTIPEICEMRMKASFYYADRYKERYQLLLAAYKVIKEVSLHTWQPTLREVIENYVSETYLIDTWYRKFYYYLDRVGLTEDVEKIRDMVENLYTNKYLTDFAYKWNTTLTDEAYRTYPGAKEEEFFDSFVKPFMHEDGKKGRVVVIISDGMRYECARELLSNLDLDEKCDASMNHMLSVLPSETTLGMASLLPHKEIRIDDSLDIFVDDMHCGNSTAERQKILQNTVKKSACYLYKDIKNASQAKIREMFQDKELIYIYHNQIDDRGEGGPSENEVFDACQTAIEEIQKLIRNLTGYVSNTRYLITADHGFIYKRDKLQESDKISMEAIKAGYKNKRYLLSMEPIKNDALISRALAYLSKLNKAYVTTPMGADIIKMPGGGQNYVHGGSSLQEMIVPVIKVTTFKGKQETDLVNVELSTFTHRVTGIEVKLEFMQMEPVTDTVKPRRLVAFFVDADGHKISFDVPITANIRDTEAKNRLITEKFTLKSGRYSRGQDYFLVIADQDDETKELHRYKFEIDISDMSF